MSAALTLALVATGPLAQATAAEEWSQYRGPGRDGQATMLRVPEVWPDQPREVVFGFSDRRKGQLFVLDPKSGKVLWEDEGRGGENAVLAMAGDWLLVTTVDATLRVMRWRDDVLHEVKRYEIASGAVWAEPGWLSDGLLVKDVRHLARLSFGKAAATAAGR